MTTQTKTIKPGWRINKLNPFLSIQRQNPNDVCLNAKLLNYITGHKLQRLYLKWYAKAAVQPVLC